VAPHRLDDWVALNLHYRMHIAPFRSDLRYPQVKTKGLLHVGEV
jgi:hypothetical protein